MKPICCPPPDLAKLLPASLLLLAMCLLLPAEHAKAQLFKAGLVGGLNFTQIDGDEVAGYNKFGAHVGFVSQVDIAPQWFLSFELLYNQKGSRATARSLADFKIVMDYADIPVLVKFHDKRGGLTFGAGLQLGRLVRNKWIESGQDITDDFFNNNPLPKKWNLDAVVDISYMFKPAWGIGLRASNSIFKFRSDPDSDFRKNGQFHRAVTLRTIFLFSALGKKGEAAE